eukprot:Opistho-2@77243
MRMAPPVLLTADSRQQRVEQLLTGLNDLGRSLVSLLVTQQVGGFFVEVHPRHVGLARRRFAQQPGRHVGAVTCALDAYAHVPHQRGVRLVQGGAIDQRRIGQTAERQRVAVVVGRAQGLLDHKTVTRRRRTVQRERPAVVVGRCGRYTLARGVGHVGQVAAGQAGHVEGGGWVVEGNRHRQRGVGGLAVHLELPNGRIAAVGGGRFHGGGIAGGDLARQQWLRGQAFGSGRIGLDGVRIARGDRARRGEGQPIHRGGHYGSAGGLPVRQPGDGVGGAVPVHLVVAGLQVCAVADRGGDGVGATVGGIGTRHRLGHGEQRTPRHAGGIHPHVLCVD